MVMKCWNWCMKSYICCTHELKLFGIHQLELFSRYLDDDHKNLYDGDEYCANNPKGMYLFRTGILNTDIRSEYSLEQ